MAAIRLCANAQPATPEIARVISEPRKDMRRRSSATIDPAITGHVWGVMPKSDARLRFMDSKYGFVAPLTRFFTVSADDAVVSNVRMSPQIEPFPIDDALNIALNLQEHWRKPAAGRS